MEKGLRNIYESKSAKKIFCEIRV